MEKKFKNLKFEEEVEAVLWFNRLSEDERERLGQTLDVINNANLNLGSQHIEPFDLPGRTPLAVIVAGTSIDTNDYEDIDLFALPYYPISRDSFARSYPKSKFFHELQKHLPEGTYVTSYGAPADDTRMPNDIGAKITVSLAYELTGFDERRPGKDDDLIIEDTLGSEKIIRYNRDIGSKFILLSRQYTDTQIQRDKSLDVLETFLSRGKTAERMIISADSDVPVSSVCRALLYALDSGNHIDQIKPILQKYSGL